MLNSYLGTNIYQFTPSPLKAINPLPAAQKAAASDAIFYPVIAYACYTCKRHFIILLVASRLEKRYY
jgi:hypothetical protein